MAPTEEIRASLRGRTGDDERHGTAPLDDQVLDGPAIKSLTAVGKLEPPELSAGTEGSGRYRWSWNTTRLGSH
jgi:hypothetical protein